MTKKEGILSRIMFHDKMIFESRDGISIGVMWNNITGKNFHKDPIGHRNYIENLKMTAGLPSGYLQYYQDFTKKDKYEEHLVPDSEKIDIYKQEMVNGGKKIMFGGATKFSDLFGEVDSKEGKYIIGTDQKYIPTAKCKEIIASWHCTQWGHTSYFEMINRDAGITDVFIKSDKIIGSSLFACIYTKTIPAPLPEKEEDILAVSGSKKIVTAKNKMTAMDVFKQCTIDGNVIRLPKTDLGKDLYMNVKTILENNGGAWKGGKIAGFQFKFNPASIFEKLQSGDKVNNKKKFQFFGTPPELARQIVMMAGLNKSSKKILEPSAGQGAIVKAIVDVLPGTWIDVCENMAENQEILEQNPNVHFICEDFMLISSQYKNHYDRIIANPPFNNGQDILHILKMYECLKEGGRIVSIMSTSWRFGKQKKQEKFKLWLKEVNAKIEDVPAGAFKLSGTTVPTVIVTIDK